MLFNNVLSVPSLRNPRLLLLAWLLPVLAAAQPTGEPLTWEESVRQAAAVNPDLRAARDNLRATEMDVRGAGSGFLPKLTGSVAKTDTTTASTVTSATPDYSAALTASQNLFAGFRDQASVAQARANRVVAEANLRSARARLSFDLKSAFAALRSAEDALTLSADILQRREQNLRLVELLYESGRENKGSLYLSQATLSQARFESLQAEQALRVAQAQFARALGRDDPQAMRLAGEVPIAAPPKQVDFVRAVQDTPDQQRAVAQVEAAKAGVNIATSTFWPSLDLNGTASRTGNDWFPEDRRNSVSLNLTVPIFSGGKDYYGARSAGAKESAAEATQEGLMRQLRAQLEQSHAGYVQAVAKLSVDEDFHKAATARSEIARSKYRNGLMSFEDWDLIESDLINRQKAVLQSRRDRVTAEAAWEQALGNGIIP
jgi:outer membrane protein TolC